MVDPRPRALAPDDLEVWASLATLLEWLPAALDTQLQRDAGLSHFEYGVLYALDDAPERTLRMSTLAGYAHSSLSRLSRAVARLERHDWVRRSPDPTDGRFTLAVLTEAGAAKVAEAAPGHVELVQRVVLGSLTRTQTRQLGEIARRITGALEGGPGASWTPPRG